MKDEKENFVVPEGKSKPDIKRVADLLSLLLSEGILQDMHWSDGSFGYFPSYLLGSIYDGMFLEAMESDLGNLDDILGRGDIAVITHWLNEKIHRKGGMEKPKDLLKRVCGKELTAQPLLDYFRKKYLLDSSSIDS